MILILAQYPRHFVKKIEEAIQQKGLAVILLTPFDIVHNLEISYALNTNECFLQMAYGTSLFCAQDIKGVYTELDTFLPELWGFFSQKDAQFAAMEWQALWQSILSSLACPVVNPPAMDALGGTLLSPLELLERAWQIGFEIPTMVVVESGQLASELAQGSVHLTYADLGNEQYRELPIDKNALLSYPADGDQIRIREYIGGRAVCIILVGDKPVATFWNEKQKMIMPLHLSEIPEHIIKKLFKLHASLNLRVAEYFFSVTPDHSWIFCDLRRYPSDETLSVHGDMLLASIIDLITGEGIL